MFERFTERARQVPVLAQDEARALGHDYIGTEHLLLGLLREEQGLAARVLDALGVTVEETRARVAEIVGQSESGPVSGQIPFTPRAKKALELSLREALALGHNHIGTEHLLLGLVRETDGVGAQILFDLGPDAETIRSAVLQSLGGLGQGRPHGGPPPWRRRRRRFRALGAARDEALDDENYDLARKLLELEIEERQKRGRVTIDVSSSESEEASMRTYTFVHHRVADFDAWKQVYDQFADVQREGGVRWQQVWRGREDPSMVVVMHQFDDAEAAKAFFERGDLKAAMSNAGVDPSSLQVEFLDEVGGGAP